jgi:hypothetical protein
MATAKLRSVVWVGFLLRTALLVTRALTATAFAAGPAIAQGATRSAATILGCAGPFWPGKPSVWPDLSPHFHGQRGLLG